MKSVERCVAMSAWGNGAGDDALPFRITRHGRTELLDHADGLMPNNQSLADRIFTFEDVNIGAADCRGGDFHEGVERPHVRDRPAFQRNSAWLNECSGFHAVRHAGTSASRTAVFDVML